MAFNNGFTYRRKLTFNNAGLGVLENVPIFLELDDSAGGYPGLEAYNNISFTDKYGTALSWGLKEFADGGSSWYGFNVPFIANNDSDYGYVYYGGTTSVEAKSSVHDSNTVLVTPMVDYGDTSHIEDWTGVNTLTKKGAAEPASASGDMGLCQDFDGSDDYIDIADGGAFDVDTELTVELYFKYENASGGVQNFLSHGIISTDGWYLFTAATGDAIGVRLNQSGATQSQYIYGAGFSVGDYYMAFTLDNSGAKTIISALSNGVVKINEATSTVKVANNAARGFEIGIDDNHNTSYAAEMLGYFLRISNTKRSQNWLKAQDKILRTQDYVTIGEQETSASRTKIIQPSTTYPRTTRPKVIYIS